MVFFYPADFTFVCPTELEDLADHYAEFQKLGVEIYARFDRHPFQRTRPGTTRRRRSARSSTSWSATRPAPISRNFDVLIEDAGLADRGTFVVDPDGKIQIVEITAGGIGRDAKELLRKIKAAQYVATHPGEVCPAKWQEGEKTLAPSLDLVGKI